MTTAVTDQSTTGTAGLTGRVARVLGAVVDVEFPRGALPALFNALTAEITLSSVAKTVTFEVAQHLGDNMVRCISMQSTDGLVRGAEVVDSGKPISVPVGDVVKGPTASTRPAPAGTASSGASTATRRPSTSSRARRRSSRPASRSSTC